MASSDGRKLRREITSNEPVVIIVYYAVVPYTSILLYPPKNSIWRTYPSLDICDDACIQGGDDDVERIVREEIDAAGGSPPVFGLLGEADNLNMSDQRRIIGRWPLLFNCQKEEATSVIEYLQKWWLDLGNESIAPVDDVAVWRYTPILGQHDAFIKSDCGCFMTRMWAIDNQLFSQAKRFITSKLSIADAVADANAAITPVIEAEAAMPGHVKRKMIISMGTPSKRMIEVKKLDYSQMLRERDELFFSQCLLVRLLGKVSMYWEVKQVIEDFESSLKLEPYSSPKEPMQELRAYLDDMENKFPILKLSSI